MSNAVLKRVEQCATAHVGDPRHFEKEQPSSDKARHHSQNWLNEVLDGLIPQGLGKTGCRLVGFFTLLMAGLRTAC